MLTLHVYLINLVVDIQLEARKLFNYTLHNWGDANVNAFEVSCKYYAMIFFGCHWWWLYLRLHMDWNLLVDQTWIKEDWTCEF
jgi:hypothetical protein